MHRIDRNVAERQVLVEVLVRAHIAASHFEAHFDRKLAAFAHRGYVYVAVQHFHVRIGLNLSAAHIAVLVHAQANGLYAVAHDFEGNLLQVQDDIGGVFHYARNRAEFVFHAFDANRGDGRAFNRTQQHAAQTVADRGAEPALKRLGRKHTIPLRKGLGIGNQTFGFLKALKHRILA